MCHSPPLYHSLSAVLSHTLYPPMYLSLPLAPNLYPTLPLYPTPAHPYLNHYPCPVPYPVTYPYPCPVSCTLPLSPALYPMPEHVL